MRFVKQMFAMWIGVVMVLVHIAMTFYLWMEFGGNDNVYAEKIATPITASFCIAIIKWFIDNQGIVKPHEYVYIGLPYLLVILIIVGAVLGAYVGGAVYYAFDGTMSADSLNRFYLVTEAALGGVFSLIFGDLYDKPAAGGEPAGQAIAGDP